MAILRVAVTGGSGRIGSHLVKHLVEQGHEVTNMDRRMAKEAHCRFIFADLRDRAQVQPIFENVDVLCHLGEIPTPDGFLPPEEIYQHNTAVGSVVLQTAADVRVPRVIYTSSCQVYGTWGHPAVPPKFLPVDETHPLQPSNVYSIAKMANEHYARTIAEHRGLSVAIFRFPAVKKFRIDEFNENEWRWFKQGGKMTDGCGSYLAPIDAARAFALAVEKKLPGCEAYHFAAKEILGSVPTAEMIKRDHPDYPALPPDFPKYGSPLNCAKAKAQLGWEPTWNALDVYRQKFGGDPQ